ncbi:hypothetical protein Tco_1021798 [Tanacetum coccineum]
MWWKDIPVVDVPIFFPHPPSYGLCFMSYHKDLNPDLDVSSPSGDRNKIYDPGICIEVESTRFLALSPVVDTLLPFSFENKDKVFNHGVLASKETLSFSHMRGVFSFHDVFILIAAVVDSWREHSYLGCSIFPFLYTLTNSCKRIESGSSLG